MLLALAKGSGRLDVIVGWPAVLAGPFRRKFLSRQIQQVGHNLHAFGLGAGDVVIVPVDGGYVDWDRLDGRSVEGPRARQDVATQVSVVAVAAVEASRRDGPCRGKPGGGS